MDKEVGYELRCADPCAFDVDYTRSLGQAAVDFLAEGGTDAMVSLQENMTKVVPIPYDSMVDPETGRAGVRMVDISSFAYRSARRFQIRLGQEDLQDKARLVGRLNRIEGQVRGLRKMIESDKECVDILSQVASVSGALKGVWLQILEDHMHGCVHRAVLDGGKDDELVHELVRHLKKMT